jgi:hypothetical protein
VEFCIGVVNWKYGSIDLLKLGQFTSEAPFRTAITKLDSQILDLQGLEKRNFQEEKKLFWEIGRVRK